MSSPKQGRDVGALKCVSLAPLMFFKLQGLVQRLIAKEKQVIKLQAQIDQSSRAQASSNVDAVSQKEATTDILLTQNNRRND